MLKVKRYEQIQLESTERDPPPVDSKQLVAIQRAIFLASPHEQNENQTLRSVMGAARRAKQWHCGERLTNELLGFYHLHLFMACTKPAAWPKQRARTLQPEGLLGVVMNAHGNTCRMGTQLCVVSASFEDCLCSNIFSPLLIIYHSTLLHYLIDILCLFFFNRCNLCYYVYNLIPFKSNLLI
uniref:Uncharacterized protein n=1 Tax=Ascaris lumbricoides TaxID=6252 RepID=A0A0M3HR87_ASCLU